MKYKTAYWLASFAVVFALSVIILGAYTRLTDAGLGCPDWPGCYGHMVLPQESSALKQAQQSFPAVPIESVKAWTEMVHRYFAMTLGSIILLFACMAILRIRERDFPKATPTLLAALVIFQALLGMWTVTLKLLPVVVMGHLLGGFAILSTLVCLRLQLQAKPIRSTSSLSSLKPWAVFGVFVVFCQIALGGWVSSNYAGIACVGFPSCNGLWVPPLNLFDAFNVFSGIGVNYQGGVLDSTTRMTIQWVHRVGALITAIYIIALSASILKRKAGPTFTRLAYFLLALLCVQFSLGVINVTYYLPLAVAVAHNAVGALLLAAMVTLAYSLFHYRQTDLL